MPKYAVIPVMPRTPRKAVSETNGTGRNFLERALLGAVDQHVVLEAREAHDLVAFFVVGMAGFDDFGQAEAAHHVADGDWRHVPLDVGHPHAHGGVHGEVAYASEGLAVVDTRKRGLLESQIAGGQQSTGANCEMELAVDVGHLRLRPESKARPIYSRSCWAR